MKAKEQQVHANLLKLLHRKKQEDTGGDYTNEEEQKNRSKRKASNSPKDDPVPEKPIIESVHDTQSASPKNNELGQQSEPQLPKIGRAVQYTELSWANGSISGNKPSMLQHLKEKVFIQTKIIF